MGRLKRFIAEVLGFEGWKVVDWWWVKPNGVRYKPVSRALVPPGTHPKPGYHDPVYEVTGR